MLSLVIDIRSDVIEGTLSNFPDQIIYSTSIHIPRKIHSNVDYAIKAMLKGIEDLCVHVTQERRHYTKEQIGSVHYILSSPWVISQFKTVKVEYGKDTEITEAVVKGIMEENRKILVTTYESDTVFIEQKIFSVELNGYPVQEYKGKKAKTLQISFAFTLSSDKIIKKIQAIAGRTLNIYKEYYHSAILLQYFASRSRMIDNKEYILIHIHGELTDVVIVKNSISACLGSFPFGVSNLIRKVSLSLKSSFETASSMLSLYEEGKLEKSQHIKMQNTLLPILGGWQAECLRSFKDIGKDVILPHTIYLSSGSPHLSFLKTTLEKSGFEGLLDDIPLSQLYITALKDVI